ncbi:hypothetical protein [Streptomyces sp. STR69]|nr:hypothetical protein [Streptomyces sp. STR69]
MRTVLVVLFGDALSLDVAGLTLVPDSTLADASARTSAGTWR